MQLIKTPRHRHLQTRTIRRICSPWGGVNSSSSSRRFPLRGRHHRPRPRLSPRLRRRHRRRILRQFRRRQATTSTVDAIGKRNRYCINFSIPKNHLTNTKKHPIDRPNPVIHTILAAPLHVKSCDSTNGMGRQLSIRSFTEDESSNEGPGFSGWSEIEVRARATQVVSSGVLYAAHSTLTRGFAIEAGQGHAYMRGKNYEISRWVESPASKAKIAHLVSGFRDSYGTRNSMRLSQIPLYWYNDIAPSWWPSGPLYENKWKTMANNSDPTTDRGLTFWADVCASYCVRRHNDDSEFMELDFTVGGAFGSGGEASQNGQCSCYAYQDTTAGSSHANKTSHVAPDDLRALEFLSRHIKIDPSQPNNTHVFAMKRDIGNGLFIPELQSTLYHRRMWEEHIDIDVGTLMNIADAGNTKRSEIATFYSITTHKACLSRCAIDAVVRTVSLKSVRFHSVDQSCFCFDTSLFQWEFDGHPQDATESLWQRDEGSVAEFYEVEYCEFVRGDTVRAHAQSNPKPPLLHATL